MAKVELELEDLQSINKLHSKMERMFYSLKPEELTHYNKLIYRDLADLMVQYRDLMVQNSVLDRSYISEEEMRIYPSK